jgi:D-alanyl-D-alanine carboxypeptidase/D-alanyl-D-alanine-endopeptidase (penicillin-binding protein 4)
MMIPMALRGTIIGILLATASVFAQTVDFPTRVAEIMERPAARRAFWGVHVVDLATGRVVYGLNSEKLFIPASNAKLFSTALALERLGPERRFDTQLVAEAELTEDGILDTDLRMIGGGDPNFSSRIVPYDARAEYGPDPMEPIRRLAEQAYEAGLRKVTGDIIGDDARYVWTPYPSGWSIEDSTWSYGAPVSALSFNDNRIEILVRPGTAAGKLARLRIEPSIDYYDVRNQTRTATTRTVAKRLSIELEPDERALQLWGDIPIRSSGRELSVAVDDPALFAALALRHELEGLGVEVIGAVRSHHYDASDVPDLKGGALKTPGRYALTLASIESAAMSDIIQVTNKTSQNLHAEMLLREVGYSLRGVGSHEAGIEEMRTFLREAGLSPWEFFLSDASGLSRKDLVSPAATVKLLRYMWNSPNRDVYVDSLATAGEDGTLDWRFSRSRAKGRVRAKTGTLSHVTALSGYATTLDGRELAFSVFVNNFGVSTSYVRNLVDGIVIAAVESTPETVTEAVPAAAVVGQH